MCGKGLLFYDLHGEGGEGEGVSEEEADRAGAGDENVDFFFHGWYVEMRGMVSFEMPGLQGS